MISTSATQLKCRQTSSLTLLSATQQDVVEVRSYGVGDVEVRCHPREEPFRDITNFHVRFLRMPGEDVECPVRRNRVDEHQHALGLVDGCAGGRYFGDQLVHRFLDRVTDSFGDSDVEAGTADDLAGLVDQVGPRRPPRSVSFPWCRRCGAGLLNEPPEVRIVSNVWAT